MNTVAKLTQKQIEKTCSGDPDASPGTRYVGGHSDLFQWKMLRHTRQGDRRILLQ